MIQKFTKKMPEKDLTARSIIGCIVKIRLEQQKSRLVLSNRYSPNMGF